MLSVVNQFFFIILLNENTKGKITPEPLPELGPNQEEYNGIMQRRKLKGKDSKGEKKLSHSSETAIDDSCSQYTYQTQIYEYLIKPFE